MRISIAYLLSLLLAGALPGCQRREPAAVIPQTVADDPDIERDDANPATCDRESTSIEEVEPLEAQAKLTVRVVIPQLGESDETFYLKRVVRRTTYDRNVDGFYLRLMVMPGMRVRGFRGCGNGGGFSGSSSISSPSPDRVIVSVRRSWTFRGGVEGEAHGEIEVPWMGTSHKECSDGTTLSATFIAVDEPKR